MSETTTTRETESRRPTHEAYWVKEREGKKSEWRQIGVAWAHADGKGLSLCLDLQPIDGRIVLRRIEERAGERKGPDRGEQPDGYDAGYGDIHFAR